VFIEDLKMIIL